MRTTDVDLNTYIGFNKENTDKYSKRKVGDHVKISKY